MGMAIEPSRGKPSVRRGGKMILRQLQGVKNQETKQRMRGTEPEPQRGVSVLALATPFEASRLGKRKELKCQRLLKMRLFLIETTPSSRYEL